jgi:hypothetical protein
VSDPARLADLVALVHAGFVGFVVGGQVLILAGWARGWAWTRNRGFRRVHLGAIGVVVAQIVLGVYCPLTLIEAQLRAAAGEAGYGETFIGHWAGRLLYHDVALWQTHVIYALFAALTGWTYWRYPPRR